MARWLRAVFFLILLVFPFGQLLRWQLPFWPEVKIQPLDFLICLFSLTWLFKKWREQKKIQTTPLFWPIITFSLLAAFSLALKATTLPLNELLPASFYLLRLVSLFLFFFALGDFFRQEKLPLKKYLLWEGLAIAVGALVQYLFLPDTRFLLFLGWDDHLFRAIGTFLDPAFTGLLLVLAFLIWVREWQEKNKKSWFFWTTGVLILLALALSFSRLAYLTLALGLGITFLFEKRKSLLAFGLLLAAIIVFSPKPGGEGVNLLRVSSFIARSENYQQVWQVIQKNWLFGVGFNTYRYTQRDAGFVRPNRWLTADLWQKSNAAAGADNSFLFVWATTGIFGFLAYLWLFGMIVKSSLNLAKKSKDGVLIFASVSVILISSFFINSLFYPWVLCWLWLLLAGLKVES